MVEYSIGSQRIFFIYLQGSSFTKDFFIFAGMVDVGRLISLKLNKSIH